MPKRMAAGAGEAGGGMSVAMLATWQAAGLSLAVVVGHVFNGSGALIFALFSVGVIWTLHRLRAHAPESRSTADLIASVSGAVPASAIRVIQFVAYAFLAAYTAKSFGSMAVVWLSDTTIPEWSGPALAVVAAVVGAALVGALPTRLLASAATMLAAFSLLVFFYVALAVIAKVASGVTPIEPSFALSPTALPAEWGPAALLVSLAIAFAGFEIPTAANHRLTSVRRPLGYAIALVALCATTAWVATNMATVGEFRYDAADLVPVATDLFGGSASTWLLAATLAQAAAALLVLVWGASRVIRPVLSGAGIPLAVTATVTAVVTLVISAGWADTPAKLWGVGSILLFVVYMAAAQANSRLDDSSTTAWALFAIMGFVLAAVLFLKGVGDGWWPVLAVAVVVGAAVAWAVKFDRSVGEAEQLDDPVIAPGGVAAVDGDRLPGDE